MEIGKNHTLKVAREVDFGLYLTNGEEDILLPMKYVPSDTNIGDEIEVFVYVDSLGRPIAVTAQPLAKVGDIASLEVKQVSSVGAFMDIGLEKDLMVPFKEQGQRMETGRRYVVKVLLDFKTNRMIGTTKIGPFLSTHEDELEEGDKVDILIWQETNLGFKVVVNKTYQGLVFHNEIFDHVEIGDERSGYVKAIREDGKLDISLQKQGYEAVKDMSQVVLDKIRVTGSLALGDKSSPEEIKYKLGMSKKNFKKILGGLYKAGQVEIFDHEVRIKVEG
ncbi:S1-like domain-containing RNA-binding protein [uncultured Roseivirga sp.]|uniref:CvfB family protein n=1 Tax=uncultured Roseivirga sp. TaxID=543088 RepID=UPI0030D787A3|tara:strand:+ start:141748 stop:142578 length:831 start_codon:yes stop_codon:yes gene_type:complete